MGCHQSQQHHQHATSISGTGLRLDGGRTFRNEGTVTQAGNVDMNSRRSGVAEAGNGTVVNAAGATWNSGFAGSNFIFTTSQGVGDTGAGAVFTNAGRFNKVGIGSTDVRTAMNNTGVVDAQAGTLTFSGGLTGTTGTLQTSGGNVVVSAPATTGNLFHNSSGAGSLNLVSNSITVFNDYDNANFGVGNAFNRRANVVVTGVVSPQRILAGGDVNQGLTGANIVNGNTVAPTLVIGNVHVGANTFTYNIANTGTSGPALRGAVQTAVNGGSITDARLSGDGVTAGNFGPIAAGGSTARSVTVTVGTAGVFAPIGTQTVSIVNNFENTRSQLLNISSSAGAAAYNLAAAGTLAPNPINLANQRVGGTASAALTIANTAPAGSFTEALNAAFGATTGAALTNVGAVNLLAGGAANGSAMSARVDTTTAGAKTGTVQVNFASDGTGTSGLGVTVLGSQTLTVNGNVYRLATGQLNSAPLNFGTVQVGQSVSQLLSVTNSATGPAGFVEDLAARFGTASGTGAGLISGTGSITGLAAGATNASALAVAVNTAAAGTVNGAIAVNYFSAGTVGGVSNGLGELAVGSSSYGVAGTTEAVATVINQASPLINTPSINLGNVRIGAASPTQFVSLTNQATTAPQAALNASISGTAPIVASGNVSLLAPGATNSSALQVGLDTSVAGAVSGTATVALVSDASNVGGCAPNCQLTLTSRTVDVAGAVYRLASPTVTSGPISLAARVGGSAPTASISITNTSPDAFTERLNASAGAAPSGFTTSGTITGLAAGNSSSAIGVSLNTATAGTTSGEVALNFTSSGVGTTGAADAALAGQNVAVSGRVYTPAVGQVNTTVVDFGIVHRGDVVAARNVSVSNTATSTALNDTLRGTFGGAAGPFAASGALGGVAAGATDTSSFNVALDTSNAGVYSGSANAALVSHNPDLADLSLGSTAVALTAQVNNYAVLGLGTTGSGALTQVGSTYTLDFGSLQQGSTNLTAELGIFNLATGPADLLNGSFTIGSGTGFTLGPFNSFANIAAGSSVGGYGIGFGASALGDYSQTITISALGTNASGFAGGLGDTTLVLRGSVVAVPEPSTWALAVSGLVMLWVARRRALRAAAR